MAHAGHRCGPFLTVPATRAHLVAMRSASLSCDTRLWPGLAGARTATLRPKRADRSSRVCVQPTPPSRPIDLLPVTDYRRPSFRAEWASRCLPGRWRARWRWQDSSAWCPVLRWTASLPVGYKTASRRPHPARRRAFPGARNGAANSQTLLSPGWESTCPAVHPRAEVESAPIRSGHRSGSDSRDGARVGSTAPTQVPGHRARACTDRLSGA